MMQIGRVVQQLEPHPRYLFNYLDALVRRDLHLVGGFADLLVSFRSRRCWRRSVLTASQVKLYAEYAPRRLIDFLRASTDYNLERVSAILQLIHVHSPRANVYTGVQRLSRARSRIRDGVPPGTYGEQQKGADYYH